MSVTYDLCGLVGIELIDPSPRDARAVDRQLGPIRGPLRAAPRVAIRFVDRLATAPLRLTGIGESGHDGESFVILRSSHKVPARVAVPLHRLGRPMEIVAERGLPAIPLLVPILNLTILAAGVVPLHAAAFVHEGRGILVTGWSKGGKTETLLAFLQRGAKYLGDEWIYLRADGTMQGIPEPIRLWRWHLDQLGALRSRLRRADRRHLSLVSFAERAVRAAPSRLARRIGSGLAGQAYVDAAPHELLDTAAIASGPRRCDAVVLVSSRDAAEVTVRDGSPDDVAKRMVHSLAYERRELVARAWEMRFGRPGEGVPLLDDAETMELDGLRRAFDGRPVLRLEHPYPVEIDALYRALAPRLRSGG